MSTVLRCKSWTLAEWEAYAKRSHDLEARLWEATRALSYIPGVSVKVQDLVIDAGRRIDYALFALETPLERSLCVDPIGVLQRSGQRACRNERPDELHLPLERRRRGERLPQWAWVIEGRRMGTLYLDILSLPRDLQTGIGKTASNRAMNYLRRGAGKVVTARAYLEMVVRAQYPNWQYAHRVFTGTGAADFRRVSFTPHGTIDFTDQATITPDDIGGEIVSPNNGDSGY
jgi:hypothetical protein